MVFTLLFTKQFYSTLMVCAPNFRSRTAYVTGMSKCTEFWCILLVFYKIKWIYVVNLSLWFTCLFVQSSNDNQAPSNFQIMELTNAIPTLQLELLFRSMIVFRCPTPDRISHRKTPIPMSKFTMYFIILWHICRYS